MMGERSTPAARETPRRAEEVFHPHTKSLGADRMSSVSTPMLNQKICLLWHRRL